MKIWALLIASSLAPASVWAGTPSDSRSPLVVVYAAGHLPVEQVTVSVTNPRHDVGILIASVEFDGQLPELRYFYHGIYGRISRDEDNYRHASMAQQLSTPVGSCFLLPGQSACWQRPLRVLEAGYEAEIAWREIPKEEIATSVWFRSESKDNVTDVYEPLLHSREATYSNIAAAKAKTPYVVLEGRFPQHTATKHVTCVRAHDAGFGSEDSMEGFPEGSINFSLSPIAENVMITEDQVFFRKYSMKTRAYETVDTPSLKPIVVDYLFLRTRSKEKTVPCILPKEHFSNLIDVKEPYTDMYYNPGITEVPLTLFPKILARIEERGLFINLKRIDPNSLGQQHVLIVSVGED